MKHRNLSHVEQEELPPMPKDRGAEQGDVDGPLALGMATANTRGLIAARQAEGTRPWIGTEDPAEGQAPAFELRSQNAGSSQLSARWPGKARWSSRPTARTAEKRRPGRSVVHG